MPTPVSPKVLAGANFSAYATLILTVLQGFTPDSFAALGKWQPLAYGLAIGGSAALGAWLKRDQLRDAGAAAQATPTPAPAPSAPAAPPSPSVSIDSAPTAAESPNVTA